MVLATGSITAVPAPAPVAPLTGTSCAPLIETAKLVFATKLACKVSASLIVTLQLPVPLQPPPLQPPKVEPASGVALSVTSVLAAKLALHTAPHSMPAGPDRTLPLPAPVRVTPSAKLGVASTANDCVTCGA